MKRRGTFGPVDLHFLLGQSPDQELGGCHGGEVNEHGEDALVGARHPGLRHAAADARLHLGLVEADLTRAVLLAKHDVEPSNIPLPSVLLLSQSPSSRKAFSQLLVGDQCLSHNLFNENRLF